MSAPSRLPLVDGEPPELLVHDELIDCPYLPGETARLPLRLPIMRLTRGQLDGRLARGERRQGRLVYTTACPTCRACEPIRIPAAEFEPSRTQKRIWRRGQAEIRTTIGAVESDPHRVWLYNRHKRLRGLDTSGPITLEGHRVLLADSPCESFELRFHVGEALVGVAICDRAEHSISAVYCCFDPSYGKLSLGVYSVLFQLDLCRRWDLDHLYLGLVVEGCQPMAYKRRYRPHEILVDGDWQRA